MAETTETTETTVRSLLAAARLSPSEEEIVGLVAGYAEYQAGIETLYAVPEARYAQPRTHLQRCARLRRLGRVTTDRLTGPGCPPRSFG